MSKLIHRKSGADVACLQFDRTFERWNQNETDNKAFLRSIVWQYNKITCSIFSHKFPVKTFFIVAEMPVRVCDQAKLLPVKNSNFPDNCPMTDCYLQACFLWMLDTCISHNHTLGHGPSNVQSNSVNPVTNGAQKSGH